MISPFTKRGTRVAAVRSWGSPWHPVHIIAGRSYTVANIVQESSQSHPEGKYGAELCELPHETPMGAALPPAKSSNDWRIYEITGGI